MSGNSELDVQSYFAAPAQPPRSLTLGSVVGALFFVVVGLGITAVLTGETPPSPGRAAYTIDGQVIAVGSHSLDLSKPVFVRGDAPVCPSEEALDSYLAGNRGECSMLTDGAQAGLVGIQTDGMRAPSMLMQMQTPNGPVKGWVDYDNLHN